VIVSIISFAMVTARDPGHIRNYAIVKVDNVLEIDEEEEEEEDDDAMLLNDFDNTGSPPASPASSSSPSDAEMEIDITINDENGFYNVEELNDEERLTLWNTIIREALERRATTVFTADEDYDADQDDDDDDRETVIYESSNPYIRILQRAPIVDEPSSSSSSTSSDNNI
jgi:hypothetical protein